MATNKITPFTFINSITYDKKDLIKDDPDVLKSYSAYVVNRGLSYFIDTVLQANEMNIANHIDPDMQYYYLMNSISKKKRFSKWNKNSDEILDLIQKEFGVRREIAKQYKKILSTDQIQLIRSKYDSL